MILRYFSTSLLFSFGATFLLNWAIVWYNNGDLLILSQHVWLDQIGAGARKTDVDVRNETCDFVVGILSARDNFEQRQAIRQTWLSSLNDTDDNDERCVKAWFIVGRQTCAVHPLDRMDVNDCVPWLVNLEEVNPGQRLLSTVRDKQSMKKLTTTRLQSGIMFKVRHAIVISKLGIIDQLAFNSSRTVAILDEATQEVVTRVVGLDASQTGVTLGGYVYRSIEPIMLPMGFVGILVADVTLEDASLDARLQYDVAGGLIAITHVISVDGELNAFDEHQTVVVASFGYTVHDFEELRCHTTGRTQRQTEWNSKLEAEVKRLRDETSDNADIVFVDVIDVYRNLPLKLLAFYDWVRSRYNFSYAMKVDDDTVLDIREITKSLPPRNSSQRSWYGHFRQNWGVERHGKWAETTYRSLTYPPFACGAAYSISADLINWLADNRHVLHPFQGEDVSLGIWLAPLNPTIVHDTRWSCADECPRHEALFSRGQLTPSHVRAAWTSLSKCHNLCRCD